MSSTQKFRVQRMTRSGRIALALCALALAAIVAMPWWASQGLIRDGITLSCFIAVAQMWNMLAGYGGLVSVGQQAFVGVAAYAMFVMAQTLGVNPFLAAGLSVIAPAILAVPVYLLLHRLEGPYFAIGLAEPLAVALHGVMRAKVRPGDRALVVGAGAIGLPVVYWARRMGASCAVAADLHDHQKDRAASLGATGFVVSGPDMAERVAAACCGAPDIVFECVGKVGLIDHCIDLVRPRGTVCVPDLCTGTDRLDSFRAISKEVDIVMAVFVTMHEFATAIEALDSGGFAPQNLVSDVVALPDAPAAFEALRRRTTQCKVLIDPFSGTRTPTASA